MAKQLVSRTKDIAKRPSRYLEEPLYHRLFKDGSSEQNVRAQMNAFLKSRKLIYKWELDDTLKKLRSFKLYSPALKLSETMAYRGINKTLADQAIHLDLIAKSNGITAAEDYFVALPESKKEIHCYGALLNVYCTESKATKAESLLEKMKELKLPLTSMSYNSMMTLYANKNQPEKILAATKEMKLAGIALDCFSYNIWMRAYASLDDIAGAERVVEEMKRDGQVPPDWTTFSNLASIYVNAGSNEEAEIALKELEKVNGGKDLSAFQFLITLYGRTGNLVEVYRVWRSLKLSFEKPTNTSYLHYIKVLVRLKDLPGAEKAFEEWLESSPAFDIRIANTLIGGYARSGSIDEAQRILKLARLRGAKPNLRTWVVFFEHYMKSGEFGAAVECVVKAIWVAGERGQRWAPPRKTVMSLMEYFEREKDVDSAEAFLERLKTCSRTLHPEILEALIRIYASAGKTSASLRRRLKMEGVDQVSEDGEKLLEIVCVV